MTNKRPRVCFFVAHTGVISAWYATLKQIKPKARVTILYPAASCKKIKFFSRHIVRYFFILRFNMTLQLKEMATITYKLKRRLSANKKNLSPSDYEYERDIHEIKLLRCLKKLKIITPGLYVQRLASILFDWGNLREREIDDLCSYFTEDKDVQKYFSKFDYAFCGFTPRINQVLWRLSKYCSFKLIFISSHRFDIVVNNRQERDILVADILEIHRDKKHVVGAISIYEQEYLSHYLKIKAPVYELCAFHYAPLKYRKEYGNNAVLFIHHRYDGADKKDYFKEMKTAYERHCEQKNKSQKFNLQTLSEGYPEGYNSLDQLAEHPAVIMFPYSTDSVFVSELYELNIPFIIPSVELLIESGEMVDRALFSCYLSEEEYNSMADDSLSPDSPNSYTLEAQKKWLPLATFYQRENTIIFNSAAELCKILDNLANAYSGISHKMYLENKERRARSLEQWRSLLA